jgi:hypothetical protein
VKLLREFLERDKTRRKEQLIDGSSSSSNNITTVMLGNEDGTELDKKMELIAERALEKHIAKLRGPPPGDPKEGESSKARKRLVSPPPLSPSKG